MIPKAIKKKLDPRRFPNISGKMIAILGWLLDIEITKPAISSICTTSDDVVMAELKGDCGFNEILGSYADFKRNLVNISMAAELTPKQLAWVGQRIESTRISPVNSIH